MSHFNSLHVLGVLLQLTVGTGAAVTDSLAESEGIVSEAKAKDPSTPTRPIPSRYEDAKQLEQLSEGDFAKMNASDPRLKIACIDLVRGLPSGFPKNISRTDPAVSQGGYRAAAFLDLQRRGNEASPMLLDLARELEETDFESSLLGIIDTLQSVQLGPFLEYSRNLLRTRTKSSKIVSAALLLGRHGTDQDVLLLEQVAAARPYFAQTIRKEAQALKAHLEAERARVDSPSTKVSYPSPAVHSQSPKKAVDAKSPTSQPSEKAASSTPWSIIVVLIVAGCGLLWLLLRRQTK